MCSATVDHPEGGLAIVVWATLGEHDRVKPLQAGEKLAGLTDLTHKGMSWTGIINSKRKIDKSCAHSCQNSDAKMLFTLQYIVCVGVCVCVCTHACAYVFVSVYTVCN